MHSVVHDVEIVSGIGLPHSLAELGQLHQCPAIKLFHLPVGNAVYRRVEIVQVAQDKAGGVADPPVDIGQLFEDIWGDADIAPEIGGGNPQPQNICAVLLPDFFGAMTLPKDLDILYPSHPPPYRG